MKIIYLCRYIDNYVFRNIRLIKMAMIRLVFYGLDKGYVGRVWNDFRVNSC